jgi:aspartate carbamoyltransferase catalytic subunit
MVFISPVELKIPDYLKTQALVKNNVPFTETDSLEEVIGELDILYMTRVQRERFFTRKIICA